MMTGKKLQTPKYKIREYFKGNINTTNDTGEERSVDVLYLGPSENECGNIVFKLHTKQAISVNIIGPKIMIVT